MYWCYTCTNEVTTCKDAALDLILHSALQLTHIRNASLQFTNVEQISEKAPSGCYVSGLYLEGARWDMEKSCLTKSHPKVLIEELPILRVIPIEAHRLKLVVSTTITAANLPTYIHTYIHVCIRNSFRVY